MLCKRCMVVMGTGTTYEQKKGQSKPSHRRFCECNNCKDRVYINSPNFQEVMKRESEKNRKRQ